MNPIEFQNNGYADILKANEKRRCEIRVLGNNGFTLKGVFVAVTKCRDNELTEMAGFCTDIPIYKICIMAEETDGIYPVWINTLLIDDITDIKFS